MALSPAESELLALSAFPQLKMTENKMGAMIHASDEYCDSFFDYVRTCPEPMKVADLGVAFGYTTKILLQCGANVTANDLSESHLNVLWNSVSKAEQHRLTLLPGNVLNIDLPKEHFDGILACRWIHFLNRDELRKVLSKCFQALKFGGKLCLTTESIYHGMCRNELERYGKEKAAGVEWPGMCDTDNLVTSMRSHLPGKFMFYDTDVVGKELERAGFGVVKIGYIDRRGVYTESGSNDGREGVGAIAVKHQYGSHAEGKNDALNP